MRRRASPAVVAGLALALTSATVASNRVDELVLAVNIPKGDSVTLEWMTTVAERSPTFREMLQVLLDAQHIRVTLISRFDLYRRTRLPGKGTFTAHDGRISALLEFDRSRMEPIPEMRAIVHELAHAVEIACLPRPADTAALRELLAARHISWVVSPDFGERLETGFPGAIVRAVMSERDENSEEGQLRTVAATFGLTLPQGDHQQ